MKRIAFAGIFAMGLMPEAAQAHLVVTGMGPVYDGACHFGLSPEDIIPVAALAFFAGLRGPLHARLSLAALAAAWLAGGLLIMALGVTLPQTLTQAATAGLFLAIGGMLAANVDLAPWVCAATAAGLGSLRGGADLSGSGAAAGSGLEVLGMAAAAAALFALAASVTLPLRRLWMVAAARVAGSWVAAAGLLLAGWMLRYGAEVR